MIGTPVFIARSMILQILRACASESEPPNTVKSWAKTKTGRSWMRPEPVLAIVEQELRPLIGQAHALTEDVRALAREAGRELERVGAVADRVDKIAEGLGRFVGTLSGLTRAGQIVGVAAGLKKGIDVFVNRLWHRGDDHE